MINNFIKNFNATKENTIVCFGDLNALHQQKRHMKSRKRIEPIKGKGMRTLFKTNGFGTFLVDEHRTSCRCLGCEGGLNHKFMLRKSPKPWLDCSHLVHGLLRCKNCERVWNRDHNGAMNIYKICRNAVDGKERPSYLCYQRQTNNQVALTSSP